MKEMAFAGVATAGLAGGVYGDWAGWMPLNLWLFGVIFGAGIALLIKELLG